jgi:hypothetical protein
MKKKTIHDGLLTTDTMTENVATNIGALSTTNNEFDTILKIYTNQKKMQHGINKLRNT